MLVIMMSVSLL